MARKPNNRGQDIFAPWKHDEKYICKNEHSKKKKSFLSLPHTIMMNEAVLRLKPSTFKVFVYMQLYSNGNQEFCFPRSIYEKITTKATFDKALKELIEYGLIEVIASGKFTREKSRYKFSEKWKTLELPQKEKRKTYFCSK